MLFRETIDSWLAGLDAPAGTQLALDDAGAVGIALANGLVLTLEVEETGMVHLHSGLRRLPADNTRGAMIEEALALNLFNRGTEGATLGLDRQSDSLVMSISRDIAALTQEDFASLLVVFAETAESLQARFAALAAPAAAEPAAPAHAAPLSAQPFFTDHADPRFLA